MSEPGTPPARRHANVVNLDEAKPTERLVGTRFGARFRNLSTEAGGRAIGCSAYEVPPGRAAMPRHYHCANEEALYVLDGHGTLRLGDETIALRPGDWVSFPVGPAHAHQVSNTGDAPLRYLAFSTKQHVDVIGYPDSQKVMAAAVEPGKDWFSTPWVRLLFPEEAAVDYMFREQAE